MLDDTLQSQLKTYLERVTQPFEIVASLDDSDSSRDMLALLKQIAGLSNLITLKTDGSDARRPSFSLNRTGSQMNLRFAAIPLGHEFTSLVLALLWVGGHPPKVDADVIEQIKNLDGRYDFEVYMSLTCHNCPDVVQALSLMAVLNPNVRSVVIDGGLFQQEVADRQIMAVPTVFLNGENFGQGRMSVEEIIAKLDKGAGARDAAKLSARDPFDVLIVGGGPAGAAAGNMWPEYQRIVEWYARDLSKPAVSRRVARLEEQLGAQLLARSARGAQPTDIGEAYYARAANILAAEEKKDGRAFGGQRQCDLAAHVARAAE